MDADSIRDLVRTLIAEADLTKETSNSLLRAATARIQRDARDTPELMLDRSVRRAIKLEIKTQACDAMHADPSRRERSPLERKRRAQLPRAQPAEHVADVKWTCATCTYINMCASASCEVCEVPRTATSSSSSSSSSNKFVDRRVTPRARAEERAAKRRRPLSAESATAIFDAGDAEEGRAFGEHTARRRRGPSAVWSAEGSASCGLATSKRKLGRRPKGRNTAPLAHSNDADLLGGMGVTSWEGAGWQTGL